MIGKDKQPSFIQDPEKVRCLEERKALLSRLKARLEVAERGIYLGNINLDIDSESVVDVGVKLVEAGTLGRETVKAFQNEFFAGKDELKAEVEDLTVDRMVLRDAISEVKEDIGILNVKVGLAQKTPFEALVSAANSVGPLGIVRSLATKALEGGASKEAVTGVLKVVEAQKRMPSVDIRYEDEIDKLAVTFSGRGGDTNFCAPEDSKYKERVGKVADALTAKYDPDTDLGRNGIGMVVNVQNDLLKKGPTRIGYSLFIPSNGFVQFKVGAMNAAQSVDNTLREIEKLDPHNYLTPKFVK